MATTKKDNAIALELKTFDSKIKQFQDYLKINDPSFMIDDRKRHDEIDCQIKIMSNLPAWLSALKKLREEEAEKKVELRGETEISGLMKTKQL